MIKIIGWAARTMSIAIIIFFAFFLSVRTSPPLGGQALVREIFTLIVTGITIAAWRIPMLGGAIFCIFGVRYFVMIARPGDLNPALLLLGCFLLTGVLFMVEGYVTKKGNQPVDRKYWFP